MDNRQKKLLSALSVALVLAAAGVGTEIYLHNSNAGNSTGEAYSLNTVSNLNVVEANGSLASFNLSAIGGFANVPSVSNGSYTFSHAPTRIVSLIPSVTATLYALHAYSDVVAVDQYSIYPVPTANVTVLNLQYGSMPIEEIANMSPDAIITTTGYFSTQDINQVVAVLGIPYIVLNPENISQIETQNSVLGGLTGTENNASLINNWMNENLANLRADTANISAPATSVFYDLGPGTSGIYTAGNGTFIGQIFSLDHLKNAINLSGYPAVSRETVYNATPAYVLLDQYVNVSYLLSSLPNLTAVKNGNYSTIANDSFFSEPDFRIVYAIYWLGQIFYPHNINLSNVTSFNKTTGLGLSQSPESGVSG